MTLCFSEVKLQSFSESQQMLLYNKHHANIPEYLRLVERHVDIYIAKMNLRGYISLFLFSLKNIDCALVVLASTHNLL